MKLGTKGLFLLMCFVYGFCLNMGIFAQAGANVIPRIGVVDLKRVYDAARSGDSGAKETDRMREQLNTEIMAKRDEIQALKEERVTAINSGNTILADELATVIRRKETEAKTFHQNATNQMKKIQKDTRNDVALQEMVSRAVSAVARTRGYTIILASTSGDLIYWTDKVDITNEIIAQLSRMS
ncbi:MAG: OmpH family outer membrane protein [Spirochaetia bacterium]